MAASCMQRVVVPYRAGASRILARKTASAFMAETPEKSPEFSSGDHATPRRRSSSKQCGAGVDVFLSHRGADTRSSVAGLLYDRLVQMNVRPFLDNRSMAPGEKLYESIDAGIRQCRVGVAIFSQRYCDSVFCLHELAMLVEANKKLIPVFCDVKPSELVVRGDATVHSPEDLQRYNRAIQEAKHTVGLSFDTKNGNWSELLSRAANIVLKCLEKEN